MPAWIDAHNHLQDPRFGGDAGALVAAMREAGVERCVVNATGEQDWGAVAQLAAAFPDFVVPAFGVHPWRAHEVQVGWQDRLKQLIQTHPGSSLGECGLDGWVAAPGLEQQVPVFRDQLEIARELGCPVTIHALKAWGPMLECLEDLTPPGSFLMHSFGGSFETARRLVALGAWCSCSGYFLHPRKAAVLDVFRRLPRERLLVESDAPDMLPPGEWITHPRVDGLNHPANLPGIARALAVALEMPEDELADRLRDNARRCFGI